MSDSNHPYSVIASRLETLVVEASQKRSNEELLKLIPEVRGVTLGLQLDGLDPRLISKAILAVEGALGVRKIKGRQRDFAEKQIHNLRASAN